MHHSDHESSSDEDHDADVGAPTHDPVLVADDLQQEDSTASTAPSPADRHALQLQEQQFKFVDKVASRVKKDAQTRNILQSFDPKKAQALKKDGFDLSKVEDQHADQVRRVKERRRSMRSSSNKLLSLQHEDTGVDGTGPADAGLAGPVDATGGSPADENLPVQHRPQSFHAVKPGRHPQVDRSIGVHSTVGAVDHDHPDQHDHFDHTDPLDENHELHHHDHRVPTAELRKRGWSEEKIKAWRAGEKQAQQEKEHLRKHDKLEGEVAKETGKLMEEIEEEKVGGDRVGRGGSRGSCWC